MCLCCSVCFPSFCLLQYYIISAFLHGLCVYMNKCGGRRSSCLNVNCHSACTLCGFLQPPQEMPERRRQITHTHSILPHFAAYLGPICSGSKLRRVSFSPATSSSSSWNPEVFPCQMGYVLPPAWFVSVWGFLPVVRARITSTQRCMEAS